MWWVALAAAQDPCATPLTAEELYAMDARSNLAVQDDDPDGHAAVMDELAARVACLDGPIPQGPWARILVNEAIVRFAQKRDWEQVLATALAVDAGVGNVPSFVREVYTAPARLEGVALPGGVRLVVDGRPSDRQPPPKGLHVVQREMDDGWHSVLLRDESVPDALLVPPPERGVPGWSTVGVLATSAAWSQSLDPSGNFLADEDQAQVGVGLASHGRIPFAGPVGVSWDVHASAQLFVSDTITTADPATLESRDLTSLPAGSGWVGVSYGVGFAPVVGFGATVIRSHTRYADAVHVAPVPYVGAQGRSGGLDAAGAVGFQPSAWHLSARGGWSTRADTGVRVGVLFDAVRTRVAQDVPGSTDEGRAVALTQLTGGLSVGLRFGER